MVMLEVIFEELDDSLKTTYVSFVVVKDLRLDNKKFYPMMKTNRVNLHYMFGAIYGDMFFHIGAASRPDAIHWIDQLYPENTLTGQEIYNAVIKDPEGFIDMVRNHVPVRHTEDVI